MQRLGVLLLWFLWRLLPPKGLAALGQRLGALLYHVAPRRRRIADTNLRLCFPEWNEEKRRHMLKAHFEVLGCATLLECITWWGTKEEVANLVRIEGESQFQMHAGKPVILLAPHFVGINAGGMRIITLGLVPPPANIFSPLRNQAMNDVILEARTRFGGAKLFPRSAGIKPVLRALKQGSPLHYSPDLDYGRKDALFLPFFGVPAATVTGLSRIAKATDAVVVPCITRWDGKQYVTRFYPAWEDFPTQNVEADTRRMNAFIEERIRERPEQYFWVHRRFKTRPKGEPGVYD